MVAKEDDGTVVLVLRTEREFENDDGTIDLEFATCRMRFESTDPMADRLLRNVERLNETIDDACEARAQKQSAQRGANAVATGPQCPPERPQ